MGEAGRGESGGSLASSCTGEGQLALAATGSQAFHPGHKWGWQGMASPQVPPPRPPGWSFLSTRSRDFHHFLEQGQRFCKTVTVLHLHSPPAPWRRRSWNACPSVLPQGYAHVSAPSPLPPRVLSSPHTFLTPLEAGLGGGGGEADGEPGADSGTLPENFSSAFRPPLHLFPCSRRPRCSASNQRHLLSTAAVSSSSPACFMELSQSWGDDTRL